MKWLKRMFGPDIGFYMVLMGIALLVSIIIPSCNVEFNQTPQTNQTETPPDPEPYY